MLRWEGTTDPARLVGLRAWNPATDAGTPSPPRAARSRAAPCWRATVTRDYVDDGKVHVHGHRRGPVRRRHRRRRHGRASRTRTATTSRSSTTRTRSTCPRARSSRRPPRSGRSGRRRTRDVTRLDRRQRRRAQDRVRRAHRRHHREQHPGARRRPSWRSRSTGEFEFVLRGSRAASTTRASRTASSPATTTTSPAPRTARGAVQPSTSARTATRRWPRAGRTPSYGGPWRRATTRTTTTCSPPAAWTSSWSACPTASRRDEAEWADVDLQAVPRPQRDPALARLPEPSHAARTAAGRASPRPTARCCTTRSSRTTRTCSWCSPATGTASAPT